MYDGKADLLYCRDAAQGLVHGVDLPRVGQLGHPVQLRRGKRHGRRVHNEVAVPVRLGHCPTPDRVVLGVFYPRRLGVGPPAPAHVLVGGQHDRLRGCLLGDIGGTAYVVQLGDGPFLLERLRYLYRGVLAHAVDEQVRFCVEDDAPAHLVLPIVVVREAAQAGLQRADDYWHLGTEGLSCTVGVDDDGPVRTQPRLFPGRVEVLAPSVLCRRVVRDHGVQVPRAYHYAQPRRAHGLERLRRVPVRLAEHSDPVAFGLQHPGNDRRAEARVVHICVPADDEEVIPPPAALVHVLGGHRQEIGPVDHSSSPPYQPLTPLCFTR